ncbi:tight adherence protein B [Clostridium cavendishii DSM 21758]|uniref:Tight adherence protein B n=1 Tax=Clostridium cavendishii DSM 21758 TaxID=1121302 RepID=A0A1M6QH87_9CLOT|nr:type II secretion system F family protein [Clostridium cavendishii]SHK19674.1 tight adherence protein B [Clostridium cavendishii DSM 21758]
MSSTIIILIATLLVIATIFVIVILVVKRKNQYEYEVIEEETEELIENNNDDKKEKKKPKKEKKKSKKPEWNGLLPNYSFYDMKFQEYIMWSLLAMAVCFGVGYIFYYSIPWAIAISLIGFIYPKFKKKNIIRQRKSKLLVQFKEALYAISSSLTAGKAVPMAFKDSYNDLKIIYEEDKECFILEELQYIIRRIDRNETIEESLEDLAVRSGLEDVETFADIFTSCTRTGGNLKEVIRNSSQIIGDKIEIKQEIETLIAGKKFEAKVLSIIPIALVLFLRVSAPDFMAPLSSISGRIACTAALIVILIANFIAKKIMNIEV